MHRDLHLYTITGSNTQAAQRVEKIEFLWFHGIISDEQRDGEILEDVERSEQLGEPTVCTFHDNF